jgi:DNA-binding XRE family transcriptional regulator
MSGTRLRAARASVGMSQSDLASRAGVSRQLVGAVEAGRHLPRVDSALALADALGVTVDWLFGTASVPIDIVSGGTPPEGAMVRVGRVGNQTVTTPIRIGPDGWDAADGVITDGRLTLLGGGASGIVVGGCEPGLMLMERMLRDLGAGAVSVSMTSTAALDCLQLGRLHAAVVHEPESSLGRQAPDFAVGRFHLARWQVGIAAGPDAAKGWWKPALAGRVPVVQREPGAGVQRAFGRALPRSRRDVPGPVVGSHFEAVRLGMAMGMPAVTIEPAARAVGAVFQPIEVHSAELWIAEAWIDDEVVEAAMSVLMGSRYQRQLAGVGGYDLAGSGIRAG